MGHITALGLTECAALIRPTVRPRGADEADHQFDVTYSSAQLRFSIREGGGTPSPVKGLSSISVDT
jgi:hypothetical protein